LGKEIQEPQDELVVNVEGGGEFVSQDVRLEGIECSGEVSKQESD